MKLWKPLLLLASVGLLSACASTPKNPNPRADVPVKLANIDDLPRYMGKWYVIAEIPWFGEKGYVGNTSLWKLRPDGKIEDNFYGSKGSLDAPVTHHQFIDTVVPNTGNAHWRVKLFWPITVSQLTLYVDPDYRYTLLGKEDKKWGWIMSREDTMDDKTYDELIARFDAIGYDTSRFMRVVQKPEQMGKPGFMTPEK